MNGEVEIIRPHFVRPLIVEPGFVAKIEWICVVIVGCKRRGGVVFVSVASVIVVFVNVASDTSCCCSGLRNIVWLTAGVRLGGSGKGTMGTGTMGTCGLATPTGGSDNRDNVVVVRDALDANGFGLVEAPPQRLYHGYLVVDVCCGPAIKDIDESKVRRPNIPLGFWEVLGEDVCCHKL